MNNLDIAVKVRVAPVNKPTDQVILKVGAHTLNVSAETVARSVIEPVLFRNGHAIAAPAPVPLVQTPAIGAELDGGIYAGITIAGNQPAQLILLPGDESMPWEKAIAWAEKQGGVLPSRIDALVLWNNLKDQFKKEWYWTDAQRAAVSSFAWIQSFRYGTQDDGRKDGGCRCRAVRRLILR